MAVFRQNRDSGVVWGAGVGVCVGVQPAAVRWYGAGGKMVCLYLMGPARGHGGRGLGGSLCAKRAEA